MKLYCVRHGHAELALDATGERPLTDEGIEEVNKVTNYMAHLGLHVSHVLHSKALRAVQTAKILVEKIAVDTEAEPLNLLAPEEPVYPFIELLSSWHDDTLIVGHMPFVSQLVSALVARNEDLNIVRFTPATVVCLERYEADKWIINWILHPDLVNDQFGK
jgi:phosphohistidine phosphatase